MFGKNYKLNALKMYFKVKMFLVFIEVHFTRKYSFRFSLLQNLMFNSISISEIYLQFQSENCFFTQY